MCSAVVLKLVIIYWILSSLQVKEEGGTVLSGYGVQLAVKNSEYKAVDDTKVEGVGTRAL